MKITQTGSAIGLSDGTHSLFLDFLSSHVIRFTCDLARVSPFVSPFHEEAVFSVKEEADGVNIHTPEFSIKVYLDFQFSIFSQSGYEFLKELLYAPDENLPRLGVPSYDKDGLPVIGGESYSFLHAFQLTEDLHFYGLGDHPGPLDKRGYEYVNWNTDYPQAHEDDVKSLYQSFPFFLTLTKEASFGLYLDNPYQSVFNFGVDGQTFFFGASKGPDDFYFFFGPSPKEVVGEFTRLTGRAPLPPRWSLGYHQSRWSYGSEAAVNAVVASFQKNDIPLSAIHLDIDYMEGFRVFTTNAANFPEFPLFLSSLRQEGIRTVAIIDPGVKVDPFYPVYQNLIKANFVGTLFGKPYVNEVWPGPSVFPSFNDPKVREYWGTLCGALATQGIAGIWCDMNEPASFKGPVPLTVDFAGSTHEEIHNVYGHYMAEATYEGLKKTTGKRPFVITRACFAGTQKYSCVWTGDNQSNWSSLQMALPQLLNLGLSGMPFVGTDIGGFGGDCPSELMNRWVEFGAFSPLMRNHSACGTRFQEPYRYDAKTLANYRKWVYFRYRIAPYFYDLFYEHGNDGLPILRPLFLEFPADPATYGLGDEMMMGPSLLVAPVLIPGAERRLVYFPQGKWYPLFGGEPFRGGSAVIEAPLDSIPLFVREGALIPLYPSLTKSLETEPEELVVRVFPGKGTLLHYQDDGDTFAYEKGSYNLYELTNEEGLVSVKLLHKGCDCYKQIRVISPSSETLIKVNG
jgi:alpha-glucosidase